MQLQMVIFIICVDVYLKRSSYPLKRAQISSMQVYPFRPFPTNKKIAIATIKNYAIWLVQNKNPKICCVNSACWQLPKSKYFLICQENSYIMRVGIKISAIANWILLIGQKASGTKSTFLLKFMKTSLKDKVIQRWSAKDA